MEDKKIKIQFTQHAKKKMKQRCIKQKELKQILLNPETAEKDRFDIELKHYIGNVEGKFLRVIGKWKSEKTFLVVSAFFDRRLLRRNKRDKN